MMRIIKSYHPTQFFIKIVKNIMIEFSKLTINNPYFDKICPILNSIESIYYGKYIEFIKNSVEILLLSYKNEIARLVGYYIPIIKTGYTHFNKCIIYIKQIAPYLVGKVCLYSLPLVLPSILVFYFNIRKKITIDPEIIKNYYQYDKIEHCQNICRNCYELDNEELNIALIKLSNLGFNIDFNFINIDKGDLCENIDEL